MLDHWEIRILYFTGVIIILLFLLLANKFINVLKNRHNRFVFNPVVLKSFEMWLGSIVPSYMERYVKEKLGAEFKQEEEMIITAEFTQKTIDDIAAYVIIQMPIYYNEYVSKFYGEDKMIEAIREKVRSLFLKFIETLVQKRMSGGAMNVLASNNAEKSNEL